MININTIKTIDQFKHLINDYKFKNAELIINVTDINSNQFLNIETVKESIIKICPGYECEEIMFNIHINNLKNINLSYLKDLLDFILLFEQAIEKKCNIKLYMDILDQQFNSYIDLLSMYNIKIYTNHDTIFKNISKNTLNDYLFKKQEFLNKLNINISYPLVGNEITNKNYDNCDEIIIYNNIPNNLITDGDLTYFIIKRYNGLDINNIVSNVFIDDINYIFNLKNRLTLNFNGEISNSINSAPYCQVSEINNLFDIYESKRFNKMIEHNFNKLKICSKCELFNECHGGIINFDNLNINDKQCLDKKMIFKYILNKKINSKNIQLNNSLNELIDKNKDKDKKDELDELRKNLISVHEKNKLFNPEPINSQKIEEIRQTNIPSVNFPSTNKIETQKIDNKKEDEESCIGDCKSCRKCF